ncbi:hypothetical protein D3C76_1623400 [compost metagenome]
MLSPHKLSTLSVFLNEPVRQLAELLNLNRDDITILQVNLLIYRITEDDAFWCSSQNDVSRNKRHMLRNITYDLIALENHI